MRWALVIAAYLGSLVAVAAVAFVVVLALAGPHSGLLPEWAEATLLAVGWLVVLVVPIVIARAVWRRAARRSDP